MKKFTLHAIFLIFTLIIYVIGCAMAVLPITYRIKQDRAYILIDGYSLQLPAAAARPVQIILEKTDPLVHEIQIDGSDSINNGNYDPEYFAIFSKSFYYLLSDWMRGAGMYNRWQDLRIVNTTSNKELFSTKQPESLPISLKGISENTELRVSLFYPEAKSSLNIITENGYSYSLYINRNDRRLKVVQNSPNENIPQQTLHEVYFPELPQPFLGENLITIARIFFVSWLIIAISLLSANLSKPIINSFVHSKKLITLTSLFNIKKSLLNKYFVLILLIASFAYTVFISLYEYQGMPHIFDGIAYYSQAKIFASGRFSAPDTQVIEMLNGPFMVLHNNNWFTTYPPGAPLMLALGVLLHIPWIINPILGTLLIYGIFLLSKEWFGKKVGYIVLILAVLSPFYSFQAGSYLSHNICLFFLVYMCYFWQLFCRKTKLGTIKLRYLFLSASCFGLAFMTRELSTLVVGGISFMGIFAGHFYSIFLKSTQQNQITPKIKKKLLWILICYSITFGLFITFYLLYNHVQTGDIFTVPRTLVNPFDKWGFGSNIGFYGKHTVAAGLVILDQLLTSLQIELYGWPFIFSLAFIPIPFILRKAKYFDYLSAVIIFILLITFTAYFYHGIALGPRYIYEALPFFIFLSARGIIELSEWVLSAIGEKKIVFAWPVIALVTILILCNLVYYTPRHLQLYYHFNGLFQYIKFDSQAVYQNRLHNAIVLTDNWSYFYQVTSAINDPLGKADVLFAMASRDEDVKKLRLFYPGRNFYRMNVSPDGKITYFLLDNHL